MATTVLTELKQIQQGTWSSGDYARIAWLTAPLGDVLCEAVDLKPGSVVLDVATGTGHVALAAARRFCHVTGIDYVPALVEAARRRNAAEGLDAEFVEADAEALPYEAGWFDYVLSAIGVMFTADHQRAADELLRVCAPGGRIGLVNWTPTGFVGQILKTVGAYVAPPPGAQPPVRWGTEEVMRELLGDRVSHTSFSTGTLPVRFGSPEHFADFFLAHYGPTLKAAGKLDQAERTAFRTALVDLAASASRSGDATVLSDWEYLVVVADVA